MARGDRNKPGDRQLDQPDRFMIEVLIAESITELARHGQEPSMKHVCDRVAERIAEMDATRPDAAKVRVPSRAPTERRVAKFRQDRAVPIVGARRPLYPRQQLHISYLSPSLEVIDERSTLSLGALRLLISSDNATGEPIAYSIASAAMPEWGLQSVLARSIAPAHQGDADGPTEVITSDERMGIEPGLSASLARLGISISWGRSRHVGMIAGLQTTFSALQSPQIGLGELHDLLRKFMDTWRIGRTASPDPGAQKRAPQQVEATIIVPRSPAQAAGLLELRTALMFRRVYLHGLGFAGLRYMPSLESHALVPRRGRQMGLRIELDDVCRAYLIDSPNGPPVALHAVGPSAMEAAGRTLWEHSAVRRAARETGGAFPR